MYAVVELVHAAAEYKLGAPVALYMPRQDQGSLDGLRVDPQDKDVLLPMSRYTPVRHDRDPAKRNLKPEHGRGGRPWALRAQL